jgi:hypothetical protein
MTTTRNSDTIRQEVSGYRNGTPAEALAPLPGYHHIQISAPHQVEYCSMCGRPARTAVIVRDVEHGGETVVAGDCARFALGYNPFKCSWERSERSAPR